MTIDEQKKYILTNFQPANKNRRAVDSDHMTEYMDLNLRFNRIKPERKEMFNFMDKEEQEKFKTLTSKTNEFSECFNNNDPLLSRVENWRKVLDSKCE